VISGKAYSNQKDHAETGFKDCCKHYCNKWKMWLLWQLGKSGFKYCLQQSVIKSRSKIFAF
jgi:hypothetical protein